MQITVQGHHNFDRTIMTHILCYLSLAYLQILVAISYQIYYAALVFQFNYYCFQLQKHLASKDHPYHKFITGKHFVHSDTLSILIQTIKFVLNSDKTSWNNCFLNILPPFLNCCHR
jgi:hypothetical protein